jgi:hypothetical protein
MPYLILSTPSIAYADAISHELWLLVRPASVGGNETTRFYTGRFAHPAGDEVAIGPIEGSQPIHKDADEIPLAQLIGAAVTADEEAYIENTISDAKGGSLDMYDMLQGIDSLSSNLRTRSELEADGWFPTDEI